MTPSEALEAIRSALEEYAVQRIDGDELASRVAEALEAVEVAANEA